MTEHFEFTIDERELALTLYTELKEKMASSLEEGDEEHIRHDLRQANEQNQMQRDCFGLNPIIDDIRKMEAEKFNSVVFEEYDEQYMYFFAAALALFVIEMLIGERRMRKKLF